MTVEERVAALERQVAAAHGDTVAIARLLAGHHPAEVAAVLGGLPREEREAIFASLPDSRAALALRDSEPRTQQELLTAGDPARSGRLLDQLQPDDAAEILSEAPELRQSLLEVMGPIDASHARNLLEYPAESAGRIMTPQFVRVRAELTAQQTLDELRTLPSTVETITDMYHLDDGGHVIGVLSLRELVTADPATRLSDILKTDVITVRATADQEPHTRSRDTTSSPFPW
jgi:magnesium transporter